MNTVSRFLTDLFFPNRCPCCDDFIRWDKLICSRCHSEIVPVYERVCRKCGKEICICAEELYYDMAAVPMRYENRVREGVLSLKRGNNKNFGEYSGKMLANIISEEFSDYHFDSVVPVPMSEQSRRKRGYNQAEIIASEISEKLRIPVADNLLVKQDTVSSQHYLNRTDRMKNISAIKLKHRLNLAGRNIILCDDVITTGSTVNRCAQLLKASGAGKILLAAAAESKLK